MADEKTEKEIIEEIVEKVEEETKKDLTEAEEAEEAAKRMEEEGETEIQETLDDVIDETEKEKSSEKTKTRGAKVKKTSGKTEKAKTTEKAEITETSEFLVPRQKYLASGIHIGMKQRTKQMRQFIYKIRPDGLAVMNLQIIDQRIRIAAKFLSKAEKIIVVSRRGIAHKAIEKFAELVDAEVIKGRFMPGTLTNPKYKEFYEADVALVVDPLSDYQAVKEAITARIPIVAICDTFNETNNIDLVIPANNKGAKSIATLFWLLAREILKERGQLKSDDEYKTKVGDFMREVESKEQEMEFEGREMPTSRRGRVGRRGPRERGRGFRPSRTTKPGRTRSTNK